MITKFRRIVLPLLIIALALTTIIAAVYAGFTDVKENSFNLKVTVYDVDLSIGGDNADNVVVPGGDITLADPPVVTLAANSDPSYIFIKITESQDFDTYMWYLLDTTVGWSQVANYDDVYFIKTDAKVIEDTQFNIFENNLIYVDEGLHRTEIAAMSEQSLLVTAYTAQVTADTPNALSAWEQILAQQSNQ